MARNVFLSVLGSTNYYSCTYVQGEFKSGNVRYIQQATLGFINAASWNSNSIGYILVTSGEKGSYKTNWLDNGHKKHGTDEIIIQTGLQSELKKTGLSFDIKYEVIKEGKDENELWQIFQTIYELLEDNDNVYIDITHGFRYLPLLTIVLLNYGKFLKNISVKHISYGNYESRNENNEAQIIDLLAFSDLHDWTSAANEFFNTGRLKNIIDKVNQNNNIELFDFSKEILTCRGVEIQNGEQVLNLKKVLNKSTNEKIPFKAIKEKIIDKVRDYKQEDVLNGFRAVKYCIDFDLIQQGITFLIESIISKVLVDIGVNKKLKLTNYKVRNVVSVCLQKTSIDEVDILDLLNVREKKYESKKQKKIKEYSSYCDSIFKLSYKNDLTNKVFNELSQKVRNDINHAGYRTDPLGSNIFKSKLADYYKICCELLSCKSINPVN